MTKNLSGKTSERESGEFPLTEIQYTYLLGSGKGMPLGGVPCHVYIEFDGAGVIPERLQRAWSLMFKLHPMMRARIMENGTQKIMPNPSSDKIAVYDLRNMTYGEIETETMEIRESLSHRKMHTESGQTCGLSITLLPHNKTRMHLDVDLKMCDVKSFQLILNHLGAAYAGKINSHPNKSWSFRNCIAEKSAENAENAENDLSYWEKRLPSMPLGPRLPLTADPLTLCGEKYESITGCVNKKSRTALERFAKLHNTRAEIVMLAAFASAVAFTGGSEHFLINFPVFSRPKNAENAVADFTKILLLEADFRNCGSFSAFLSRISARFEEDVKHLAYSGIKLQNRLASLHPKSAFIAPVVFSCTPGTEFPGDDFSANLGTLSYIVSQTPQVWLDSQIYETRGGYVIVFVTPKNLFSAQTVEDMFGTYVSIIDSLADDQNFGDTAPWVNPSRKMQGTLQHFQ